MKIILTSENKSKVAATTKVFDLKELDTCKTSTLIEQPFGKVQTVALNLFRISEFLNSEEKYDCIVSIESGIGAFTNSDNKLQWADFANGIIYFEETKAYSATSELVWIPEQYNHLVKEAKRYQKDITFGELLSMQDEKFDAKDWQINFSSLTREDQITNVLQKLKTQIPDELFLP